ncbi:unnamed protein product [Triticum turgidum subsp. durum]|uniref:ATP-dependent DNA helicase 2 subunit KU80 n=1 Tax=Triticum turgidum subsp. durum TaxID=4567 RepID=A0A9R0SJG4_TRITD|nr:unnamed protein product [Triticum turgidum subsp. durum]
MICRFSLSKMLIKFTRHKLKVHKEWDTRLHGLDSDTGRTVSPSMPPRPPPSRARTFGGINRRRRRTRRRPRREPDFPTPRGMARNKEGLVLLLDVGPSMHRALPEVENVCTTLVRKKASGTLFPSGTLCWFFIGATRLALSCLELKKHTMTSRGNLGAISMCWESGVQHNSVMDENDRLLYHFRDRSVAKVVQVDTPTALLGALKTRNVLPVTIFRGDLEVSSTFKIKVWAYKKTSEEKFPTLKKYSDKAPPSDQFASHEVKVDYEYKSILEPDTVIPPDQRIKGYLYGPQVVPISSAEWEAVKFKPEKGVKLLGFADRSSIPRSYFMKDVNSFVPEPGNTKAMVAVSALARAMQEMNKVAILRCVWRQNQANVAFGVLTPNISSVNNVPDSFYFNILPFAEDIRDFPFRSFSSLPPSSQPTEEQQEAADNLVKMLDLAPPGREEILRPDFTPNPMLERFYSYLDLKSKQPDANPPPLDSCLRRITEPDPDVINYRVPLIQNLGKSFELKENPKRKKARTQERLAYTDPDDQAKSSENNAEKATAADGQAKKPEDPYAEKARAIEVMFPSTEKVGKIGDVNPVKDFEAMLAERSSSIWVQKAIEEMKKYTTNLVENSLQGDYYEKALKCFVALRKACIIEQEPEEYNQFVTKLYERLKKVDDVVKFFQLLSSKNVLLICKEEAPDSDVTEEMARSFFLKTEISSE